MEKKFKIKAFVPTQSLIVYCDDVGCVNRFIEYQTKCGIKKFIIEVQEENKKESKKKTK